MNIVPLNQFGTIHSFSGKGDAYIHIPRTSPLQCSGQQFYRQFARCSIRPRTERCKRLFMSFPASHPKPSSANAIIAISLARRKLSCFRNALTSGIYQQRLRKVNTKVLKFCKYTKFNQQKCENA